MIIDRYIIRQTAMTFALALCCAAPFMWIAGSLRTLSLVVEGGDPLAFLQISALALPETLTYLAPLLAALAGVWVVRRMADDNETFAILFAGAGPWRQARPFWILAAALSAGLVVAHSYAVPASKRAFVEALVAERARFAAAAASAGLFIAPAENVTVFIHKREDGARLTGLLVHDERAADRAYTYAADEAVFVDGAEGPLLVMFNGSLHITPRDKRVQGGSVVARFDKFTLDLASMLGGAGGVRLKDSRRYLHELIGAGAAPRDAAERRRFSAEAHVRVARALTPLSMTALMAATLLAAPLRRRNGGRAATLTLVLSAALMLIAFGAERAAARPPWNGLYAYAPHMLCLLGCFAHIAARARRLPAAA